MPGATVKILTALVQQHTSTSSNIQSAAVDNMCRGYCTWDCCLYQGTV